jgi:hypothetical protein
LIFFPTLLVPVLDLGLSSWLFSQSFLNVVVLLFNMEDDRKVTYELDEASSPSESDPPPANGTVQDARDMMRLGKRQQFQVGRN